MVQREERRQTGLEILPVIVVVSLRIDESGKADNERLLALANAYCESEFGERRPALEKLSRVWVALEVHEGGESGQVVGILGMTMQVDVPLLQTWNQRAAAKLLDRARTYLQDSVPQAANALIYIEPGQEGNWQGVLERLKAKPANRWVVPLGTGIEV